MRYIIGICLILSLCLIPLHAVAADYDIKTDQDGVHADADDIEVWANVERPGRTARWHHAQAQSHHDRMTRLQQRAAAEKALRDEHLAKRDAIREAVKNVPLKE